MVSNVDSCETLLERVGGIPFISILLNSLYDELLESPKLEPLFRRSPIETIKSHQAVFFRLVLGSDECMPSQEKLINYILVSHSRLFRDAGLNETHFDLVANCLVITLQSFHVEVGLIDEILSIVSPLRAVFEYGAKIAASEKNIKEDARKYLPQCSAQTMGTDIPAVLPNPPFAEVPLWLPEEIKKISRKKSLREWTSTLADRCSSTGDILLADVMMDIPIFQLESYLAHVLQLAFHPERIDDNAVARIVEIVRHPRGFSNEPLSCQLFDRLVAEFGKTCDDLDVKHGCKTDLVEKLRSFRNAFPKSKSVQVNGVTNPSPMLLYDDSPGSLSYFRADATGSSTTQENKNDEQTKRFSLSRSTMQASLFGATSHQNKHGIRKWFGSRKRSMDMKVTI